MPTQTLVIGGEVDRWEQAIYAFLAEKERRSGFGTSVLAHFRMLFHFFGSRVTADLAPDQVASA